MIPPDTHKRTYAERFLQAELSGKIQTYHYSYSPEGTNADRRYVFVNLNGEKIVLFHSEAKGYLDGLGV